MDVRAADLPTEKVIDYVFRFANGEGYTVTTKAADKPEERKDRWEFTIANPDGTKHRLRIYRLHVMTYTTHARIVTVYPPGESPVEQEMQHIIERQNARNPVKEQ